MTWRGHAGLPLLVFVAAGAAMAEARPPRTPTPTPQPRPAAAQWGSGAAEPVPAGQAPNPDPASADGTAGAVWDPNDTATARRGGTAARQVVVPVRRLPQWLAGFNRRHGDPTVRAQTDQPRGWSVTGADGATAWFPWPAWLPTDAQEAADLSDLPARAAQLEYIVLLIRRAGYLVAIISGGEAVASKVSSRHIHGRTAAGGWSQKRYARRRDNQADEIAGAAAANLAALLVGRRPAFLATGGDRPLVEEVLRRASTSRTSGLPPRGPSLAVGTPDRAALSGLHDLVTSLSVSLDGPA